MGNRHDRWREAERLYRAYVDPDEKDAEGKQKYPWAKSVVIPVTYATVQTALSFDMAAFTQRQPVVALDGAGPEDVRAAKVMEQALHYEWRMKRMILELYTWLLDRRRYGVGILWNAWGEDASFRTTREKRRVTLPLFGTEIELGTRVRRERVVTYEGNVAQVVDPYRFWWDHRVGSISRVQDGEFIGRTIRRSWSYMREQSEGDEPLYMNVDHLPRVSGKRGMRPEGGNISDGDSMRDAVVGLDNLADQLGPNSVDFLEKGYVELDEGIFKVVPSDYGLGTGTEPEKFWLTLGNDTVIVRAATFDYDHDQYPAAVMEGSLDAHSSMNPGNPEQLSALQDIMSWLFNSHYENVRKLLNDMLIVDPSIIEYQDLLDPQPGRHVRIRKEYYGELGVLDRGVKQLQVQDVTQGNLRDMQVVLDMIQRTMATPENIQGVTNPRDKTLGEQQMVQGAASGRLSIECRLAWEQGMNPWTNQRIANIQQLMETERWMQVVGEYPRALGVKPDYPFVKVDPDSIQGQFMYQPIDGNVKNSAMMIQSWERTFSAVAADPELRGIFNVVEMFRFLAQLHGISNIDEYVLQKQPIPGIAGGQPNVMQDERVIREVERGNLVPAGGEGGAGAALA